MLDVLELLVRDPPIAIGIGPGQPLDGDRIERETELGLFLDILVHKRKAIDLSRLGELYTINPARLLGLDRGTLSVGAIADVTLINPGLEWTVDKEASASRSRNNPFHGWELRGRAVRTIVGGQTVWEL